MQLTEHFTLEEFTTSSTAKARGIDNSVSSQRVVENLRNLCEQVLEPLRSYANQPITISSGYRCKALNKVVGGARNSQHMTGEAADIHIPLYDFKDSTGSRLTDIQLARDWMQWLTDNTDFDQLILETVNRRIFWLHVSCKRDRSLNRHQVIRFMQK
jgi:hypothetical protein